MTLRTNDTEQNSSLHYAECRNAGCCVLFFVMLSVIMLSVVLMNVVVPSVLLCEDRQINLNPLFPSKKSNKSYFSSSLMLGQSNLDYFSQESFFRQVEYLRVRYNQLNI